MTERERRSYDAIGAWVIIAVVALVAAVIISQVTMFLGRVLGWQDLTEHVSTILLVTGVYLVGRRRGQRDGRR